MPDSERIEFGQPGYWAALRKDGAKVDRSSWAPIVIEPAAPITSTACTSAQWYLSNAPALGWAVRATQARHYQPPANSGNYAGRWAEYATVAVRLLHKGRNLSAWGAWQHDPEGNKGKGQWSFSTAMWAYVPQWSTDGRRPVSILIMKARAGSCLLAADELKCVVKGVPYEPVERERKERADAKPRASKSAPKRVMA